MRTIFAMSLALVVGFCSTSEGSAVFPQLDGGPFDGATNVLGFTVNTGTFNDADSDGSISIGDTFSMLFDLTSNSGGPVLPLQLQFDGTITGTSFAPGPPPTNFADFNGSGTLIGNGINEISLTVVQGSLSSSSLGTLFEAGFSATTIDPPIAPGSVSFIPVAGTTLAGSYDFILGSGAFFGGTGLNFNVGAGTITGTAQGLVNPIPEPASILTLLGCVAGAGLMRARRRRELVAVEAA